MPPEQDPRDVVELRLHIEGHDGWPRRLCKIAFVQGDASIFIYPAQTGGGYFYGRHTVAPTVSTFQIPYRDHHQSESVPEFSIHESGEIHVKVGGHYSEPLMHWPLRDFRGQRVAVVQVDSFDALPVYSRALRTGGRRRDVVAQPSPGSNAATLELCLNGRDRSFPGIEPQQMIEVGRASLDFEPLFVGLRHVSSGVVESEDGTPPGVTVLADKPGGEHVLFLRCQGS